MSAVSPLLARPRPPRYCSPSKRTRLQPAAQSCDQSSLEGLPESSSQSCHEASFERLLESGNKRFAPCLMNCSQNCFTHRFAHCSVHSSRQSSVHPSVQASAQSSVQTSTSTLASTSFQGPFESCLGGTGGCFGRIVARALGPGGLGRFPALGGICTILHIEGSGVNGNSARPASMSVVSPHRARARPARYYWPSSPSRTPQPSP